MSKTTPFLTLLSIVSTVLTAIAQGPSPLGLLMSPADVTISCSESLYDPGVTGKAVFPLGGDISHVDQRMDWDECSGGTILRRFTAVGPEGLEQTAEQVITIERTGTRHIQMPESFCANCVNHLADLSPDQLPEGQGWPIVHGDGCSVSIYHEDEVAILDRGKRVRIQRVWTVDDPCSGLPPWKHLQVIGSELIAPEEAELLIDNLSTISAPDAFELLQNRPNPFTNGTVIGFVLREESPVHLQVVQADGRLLQEWEGNYPSGYNEVTFDREGIQGQSVLYYTLIVEGHRKTKRMVLVH